MSHADAARPNPWLEPWQAWRERRVTARCCRELVSVHDRLWHDQPWLRGRPLYLHAVAELLAGDFERAEQMLRAAENSYTIWPAERPLRLVDVAHYLAVLRCQAAAPAHGVVTSDLRPIVEAQVGRSR